MSDDRAAKAIELAIAAAGQMGPDPRVWRRKVWNAVGEIASMMGSDPQVTGYEYTLAGYTDKLLKSVSFRATFIEIEPEYGVNKMTGERSDKPSRLIVRTQSDAAVEDDNPEGIEETRTEPLFTEAGRVLADRLKTLKPGDVIQMYKYVDSFVDARGKSKKVRVLTHFELLWRPKNAERVPEGAPPVGEDEPHPRAASPDVQPAATEPTPTPASVAAPSTPASSEAGGLADNKILAEIQRRVEALDPSDRVSFYRACGKAGITDPLAPGEGDTAKVLAFLAAAGDKVSDDPSE